MNAINWKTSLIGIAGAVIYAVLPLLQGGTIILKDVIIAAVVAAVSFLAKDKDVSGVGVDAVRPTQP